jgi:hypothetical protein
MKRQKLKAFISPGCLLLIAIFHFSCKKQIPNCCAVNIPPQLFEIVDKSGNSIVHSVNDQLLVTYQQNGATVSNQLDIFRVQTSATDTTRVSKYNGLIISDGNPDVPSKQGYIVSTGATNYKIYLNGQLMGDVYFNYAEKTGITFSMNGNPAGTDNITGFLTPGYPANLGYVFFPTLGTVQTTQVEVLSAAK